MDAGKTKREQETETYGSHNFHKSKYGKITMSLQIIIALFTVLSFVSGLVLGVMIFVREQPPKSR